MPEASSSTSSETNLEQVKDKILKAPTFYYNREARNGRLKLSMFWLPCLEQISDLLIEEGKMNTGNASILEEIGKTIEINSQMWDMRGVSYHKDEEFDEISKIFKKEIRKDARTIPSKSWHPNHPDIVNFFWSPAMEIADQSIYIKYLIKRCWDAYGERYGNRYD